MEDSIKSNFEYYKANIVKLQKEYKGKYVLIKDLKVVYSHADLTRVIEFSKKFGEGTFIIQNCSEIEGRTFHSRVGVRNEEFTDLGVHF
jgi:hypothetical protein